MPANAAPALTLGYVILYVQDVAASLTFYEKAFGLARRFFHNDQGKAYGELDTGDTRLSFVSLTTRVLGASASPILSFVASSWANAACTENNTVLSASAPTVALIMMGLLPIFERIQPGGRLTSPHFHAALIRLSYFDLMSSRSLGGMRCWRHSTQVSEPQPHVPITRKSSHFGHPQWHGEVLPRLREDSRT